jgi:hypothetical protein
LTAALSSFGFHGEIGLGDGVGDLDGLDCLVGLRIAGRVAGWCGLEAAAHHHRGFGRQCSRLLVGEECVGARDATRAEDGRQGQRSDQPSSWSRLRKVNEPG